MRDQPHQDDFGAAGSGVGGMAASESAAGTSADEAEAASERDRADAASAARRARARAIREGPVQISGWSVEGESQTEASGQFDDEAAALREGSCETGLRLLFLHSHDPGSGVIDFLCGNSRCGQIVPKPGCNLLILDMERFESMATVP